MVQELVVITVREAIQEATVKAIQGATVKAIQEATEAIQVRFEKNLVFAFISDVFAVLCAHI